MSELPTDEVLPWRVQARRVFGLWGVSLLLLWPFDLVQATIYACPTQEGTTVFQDRPCPMKKRRIKPVTSVQQLPFGIHESWFELPGQAEGRAFCDRRGCECGSIERRHEGSLSQAVADALYMDGGWHRYETSYTEWLDTPTSSGDNYVRRTEMVESACNVMMSQQLLREYATEVASALRQRLLTAEERGFDVPGPCDAGDAEACEYYDAVELYRRMLDDAKALSVPRQVITTSGELPNTTSDELPLNQ